MKISTIPELKSQHVKDLAAAADHDLMFLF
jgi:hypothetical protein